MKKQIFSFLILIFLSSGSYALNAPKPVEESLSNSFLIGESDLKYFGFKVYNIELWSEKKQFSYAEKFAIHITYNMKFSKENLAKRSIEEIERLHVLTELEKKSYYQNLLRIFSDVKKGDEKIAIFIPQKGVEMYHNNQLMGNISDVKLARLFVDIWLDKRSSFPEVTKKLLSEK